MSILGPAIDKFCLSFAKKAKLLHALDDNISFSGPSIYFVLAMLDVGARESTADQLANLLGFDFTKLLHKKGVKHPHEDHSCLEKELIDIFHSFSSSDKKTSNKLFHGGRMRKSFTRALTKFFSAEEQPVDFGEAVKACKIINDWVSKTTHGRIQKIVDLNSVSSSTKLVCVNTVFFKSKWLNPFSPNSTADAKFNVNNNTSIVVKMMNATTDLTHFTSHDGLYSAVVIPYKDEGTVAIVILPKDVEGLSSVLDVLSPDSIQEILKAGRNRVVLQLPKFHIKSSSSVKTPIQQLGVTNAFDADAADFTGAFKEEGVFLSDVLHAVDIEVDEEGTVAAAATAGVVALTSFAPFGQFHVDHPFIFLVFDTKYGINLFTALVTRPS